MVHDRRMAIIPGRRQAQPETPLTLFLIGMRVNRLLAVSQWLPVMLAMPQMQAELARRPDAGLLWQRNFLSGRTSLTLQYWQSREQLFAYAHDRDSEHSPAWAAFNRRARNNDAVGIWHETYDIARDTAENIYNNMPAFGLGGAIGTIPALSRMGGLRDPFFKGPFPKGPFPKGPFAKNKDGG
jgi:hypothetical protein